MSSRPSIRRRRDRGFSLIVVFLLVVVMVGVAAQVLLSTQEDLAVSGQDRESLTSFYAAEYAVAQAKDWIEQEATVVHPTLMTTFTTNGWTPILADLVPTTVTQGCQTGPSLLPGTAISPRMGWKNYNGSNGTPAPYTQGAGAAVWRFCIHNNADDPVYQDSNHTTAGNCPASISPDVCDNRDPLHYMTVDAWGTYPADATTLAPLPGAALTHLSINIGPPAPRTVSGVGNCSYSVEGGCSSHVSNGGVVDTTTVQTSTGSVR